MSSVVKVSEVFRSTGQPVITYVERDSGTHEKRLSSYLDEAGQLCLVTGPSKTGKTTLYKRVLAERGELALIVQCTKEKKSQDIWKEALEQVNFDRVSQTSQAISKTSRVNVEVQGEASWAWLAKLVGKLGLSQEDNVNELEIRERILSSPSPDLLIPVLKHTNYVLVIEDFHYLDDSEKQILFQQWKRFVDSEISIIVLGTSHRAVDIAASNKDLLGRIGQIDISQWSQEDLRKICNQGFHHLRIQVKPGIVDLIATESVGLPIVTQQICLEILSLSGIYTTKDVKPRNDGFTEHQAQMSFYEVARNRYSQFETYYQSLVRGPREKQRIYKTYELVLACFTRDPIQFDLTRSEIDHRLDHICADVQETRPPSASVNSTLGALQRFQTSRNFELLEWRPTEDKLYIIEPSFLFYVRWRTKKNRNEQLDFFEQLLKGTLTSERIEAPNNAERRS
ncbi:ATP-binding protein [Sinorhizobium meliloti]|uniref:AAA family ATPase n=1 Tax=Rhizobium meliloti TaxID=382 RepID=UPI00028614F3|nr:ATP-binding protein [Sinorhizobium meliloti]ASP79053.1 ATP-binding protein [Sinorhizobium meliloti]MQW18302.1 AAA family ATPase [Sinorhizobium meliloti]QND25675.1 ATP-binding protein [Sinorhizobium meliloti]RMI21070.1 ATP-binding protein [Sinorhizobium meliloti]RVH99079.1 ATP-binding protein [Sinorhizobium meliloti]